MSEVRKLRIVVADDHPMILEGFATIIRACPEFEVVGEFLNGQDLLDQASSLAPDIAVVDRIMPGLHGMDVLAGLREKGLATKVILMSAAFEREELIEASGLGLSGIVRKDAPPGDLVECLRSVGRAKTSFPEGAGAGTPPVRSPALQQLTAREREVAELAAQGVSNKHISSRLEMAEGTVKVHLYNIFKKLSLQNRTQLANLLRRENRGA